MSEQRVWTGPEPDEITAWTIVQAGHVVGRRFWSMLGTVGLTPVQFGVLLHLDLKPGLGNAELARIVMITPQSMSELMVSLEELGLVERDPSLGRGRRVAARLTEAGRRRLAQCAELVDDVEASLDLPRDQATALNAGLRHILTTPSP
ncbi:winged helix-turn-helix transcriptional regulator [Actinomadura barringtoniae]|uniref:Winged helix-turn-helix transcriptional regulator n=1 Tax=Actinomadura barringtoniae TaxID=1427535 RepID=A0A939PN32_9ACTN|nr:MarR family winged helix-turn-helix transcriptional regulator [Actinomadura barringtoniae]MBO2453093.1 winged helix-turn-helix transcriptional regulator [Actinomadura barringtoniae]